MEYAEFLETKKKSHVLSGFHVELEDLTGLGEEWIFEILPTSL